MLRIVYVGGGSLKVVPLARQLLKLAAMRQGVLVLYDLFPDRAATVGRMIEKTPEYQANPIRLVVSSDPDAAVDGADFVYFGIAQATARSRRLAGEACMKYDLLGYPDNVTPRGSFSACWNAPIILDLAGRMQRLCPKAWLIVFTNPIAVLSAAAQSASGIRSVGVCAGFTNHNYDLARIMGRLDPDFDLEVEAAGVNHCSWIVTCRRDGRDFWPMLEERLARGVDWSHLASIKADAPALYEHLMFMFPKMIESHQRYGGMLFSSEPDSLAHFGYYQQTLARHRRLGETSGQQGNDPSAPWGQFTRDAAEELPSAYWQQHDQSWKGLAYPQEAIGVRLIEALCGERPQRLVATYRNQGALANVPNDWFTEYSMDVASQSIQPAGRYELPADLRQTVSQLASHQHQIAQALVAEDRQRFVAAMAAYPQVRDEQQAERLVADLAAVDADRVPAYLS